MSALSDWIVRAAAVGGLAVITTEPPDVIVILPSVSVFCGVVTLVSMVVLAAALPHSSAATAAESNNARLVKAYLLLFKGRRSSRAEDWMDPFVTAAPNPWARPPRAIYLSRILNRRASVVKALRKLGFFAPDRSGRWWRMVKKIGRRRSAPDPAIAGRQTSGGFRLAFDHLHLAAIDGNAARLLLFRDYPLQVDMEQSVLELRALDLDVLGQLEAALERTAGDTLIKESRLALVMLAALALHHQHAFAHLDIQFLFAEARDRQRDAVMGLVGALDVVGRIGLRSLILRDRIQKVEQPVEADGRSEQGGEIKATHVHSLLSKRCVWLPLGGGAAFQIAPEAIRPSDRL